MKRIYTENIIISILSIWGVSAATYALQIPTSPLILTNSVYSIFAVAGIWILLKKVLGILDKRLAVCAGILGFLFAVMIVIGTQIYWQWMYGVFTNVYAIFGVFPMFAAMSALVLFYYDKIVSAIRKSRLERGLESLAQKVQKKNRMLWVAWGIIFACWIPGLLAAFPGIYGYDSIYQMNMLKNGIIGSHHPIAHTYLLGGCLNLGKDIWDSYEAGMLIYSLLQMLFMSLVFAYIVRCVGRQLSRSVQLVALMFYAFVPYNILFSFSSTKDVIFAGLFAVLVLKSYELARRPEEFFTGWQHLFSYATVAFALCAFRNNGFYVFLCLAAVVLIVCRRYWKKALALILSVVVCWGVYTGPIYSALEVIPGPKAEMLSVPMQQLSYVMCTDDSKLTEEEKQQIADYIPDYQNYVPRISDFVKLTFNNALFEENPIDFIKLWASVGTKYPAEYMYAFLQLNLGFWYPDVAHPDPETHHPYIEYENSSNAGDWILVQRKSLLPELSEFYEKFAKEIPYQKIPVISMLFQPGFTFWLICLGIMLCIYKKKYEMAVPFSAMVGLWLTLILSPVVLLRYMYPLMISIPMVFCMCSNEKQKFLGESER